MRSIDACAFCGNKQIASGLNDKFVNGEVFLNDSAFIGISVLLHLNIEQFKAIW